MTLFTLRRQAEQLTLARRRAQPAAAYIARMTGTAVFAYLLALVIPAGTARPVLAPLTALLVVQATLFQMIRSAMRRVLAVTAGVLIAVAVAAYVPFSWWVLGLLIAGTLGLAMALRLGAEVLEVPISAMLIFSVDTHAAATGRIVDTLIGAGAGLAAGLLFAPLRVQPAKDAVVDLSRQMATLLSEMAAGLADVPEPRRAAEWLDRTRALRGEIERVDDALGQAEESIRLNPRLNVRNLSAIQLPLPGMSYMVASATANRVLPLNPAAGLRQGVETLERAATDVRVLARSVVDSARIDSDDSPVRDTETRAKLASVLGELAAAVRTYGELVEAGVETGAPSPGLPGAIPVQPGEPDPVVLTARLNGHLAEARRAQDQLADLLRTDPDERPEGWPLRGEILAHVDRLRTELHPATPQGGADASGPLRAIRGGGAQHKPARLRS